MSQVFLTDRYAYKIMRRLPAERMLDAMIRPPVQAFL
jgi:hypothetical protein